MRNSRILALPFAAILLQAAPAFAQLPAAPEVIMRRPIPLGVNGKGHSGWNTDVFKSVDSSGNLVVPACGNFLQLRNVWCQDDSGSHVAEINCKEAKPETTQNAFDDSGCTYAWDVQNWEDPGESCTATESQTRAVICRRDLDAVAVSDSLCPTKPDTTRTVEDYASCSYEWQAAGFQDPGSNCTAAEVQPQTVTCHRTLDDADVGPSFCDPATKPPVSQTLPDYSSCHYSWITGDYVDPGSACTATEVQTRSVTCHRDLDDALQSDSMCADAKPAMTQSVPDYSSCSYAAANWTAYTPSSTCSASATKTRTAQCKRSDGTIVADSECASRSISLSETLPEANYSTCTSSWVSGSFDPGGASCTATETQTRSVLCKRDLDDAIQPDASCTGIKPATTQSVPDYSSCSYSATNWSGYSYGSTCSASTPRTRTAQCLRSDGTIVPATDCTSRSVAVTESVNVPNYTGCSYAWDSSAPFGDPGASCTAAEVQTRAVYCRRTLDNAVVGDASCTAAKPATTQSVADYSGCTYYGGPWWGDFTYSSTCSASSLRTQHRTCYRSDGTPMASADPCINSGVPVTEQVYVANYSGCGYTPGYGAYGACNGGSQTSSIVNCQRSDGTYVDVAYCGGAGMTQTAACTTYAWAIGGYSGYSACSNYSQTRTRSVQCLANGVTVVADGFCGAKPATSETIGCVAADGSCGAYQNIISLIGSPQPNPPSSGPNNYYCASGAVGQVITESLGNGMEFYKWTCGTSPKVNCQSGVITN